MENQLSNKQDKQSKIHLAHSLNNNKKMRLKVYLKDLDKMCKLYLY